MFLLDAGFVCRLRPDEASVQTSYSFSAADVYRGKGAINTEMIVKRLICLKGNVCLINTTLTCPYERCFIIPAVQPDR